MSTRDWVSFRLGYVLALFNLKNWRNAFRRARDLRKAGEWQNVRGN
jgi:hypothetical protein